MANGIYTPLQLNTVAGMMNNQGIKSLPTALTSAIASYNAQTVITNWLSAVNYYQAQSFKTESTLHSLLNIGSTNIPSLGNSIPAPPLGNFPDLYQEYLPLQSDDSTLDPYGFADLVQQTGNAYLGIDSSGQDLGKFCQGFTAVQNYIDLTNSLINSTHNGATYLGPTFVNMDNLVTNNITSLVTSGSALSDFGTDLANQGLLTDTKKLDLYGTPAALLAQIAKVGKITGTTLPAVRTAMFDAGLSNADITNLVNLNLTSFTNPNGLSVNEFDRLQKAAYQAFTKITGSDLQDVLDILEITTPNIVTMADILNPVVMFPNSYTSLATPTPNGARPIYQPSGAVNMNLAPIVSAVLPTPSGCDELGKIIPPDQAVANKAVQAALQQVSDIVNTTWPELASTVQSFSRRPWQSTRPYLINDVVADAPTNTASSLAVPLAVLSPSTVFYQAIQDVPAGTNITDTAYWEPLASVGPVLGLNTMTGLPQIQALTNPVAPATTSYIDSAVATGSGPDGTITTCDVIGTAIDYHDMATLFTTVSIGIAILQAAGVLASLNTAYTNITAAANDAAVITQINNANTAIAALAVNPTYASTVNSINTSWVAIASYLNAEKTYQIKAGINYFELLSDEKVSIMAFCQLLSQYGRNTQDCGAYDFLQTIADTATLAGQAMIGSLREGENQQQLASSSLPGPDIKPSADLPTPAQRSVPVVN